MRQNPAYTTDPNDSSLIDINIHYGANNANVRVTDYN